MSHYSHRIININNYQFSLDSPTKIKQLKKKKERFSNKNLHLCLCTTYMPGEKPEEDMRPIGMGVPDDMSSHENWE